jgi:hypothetical protein
MPLSPTRHLVKNKENGKDLCDKLGLAACRGKRSAEHSDPGSIFRFAAGKIALQHGKSGSTAKTPFRGNDEGIDEAVGPYMNIGAAGGFSASVGDAWEDNRGRGAG